MVKAITIRDCFQIDLFIFGNIILFCRDLFADFCSAIWFKF